MASAIFDTHSFVKRLTAAGMPGPQAEDLAGEQFRLLHEQIATKSDVAAIQADIDEVRDLLRADIVAVRREMEAMERRLRDQLTVRSGGMLGGAIILVGALVKLL